MNAMIHGTDGRATTVAGVTAVVRRPGKIICLQGETVIADFPTGQVLAYALVPDHPKRSRAVQWADGRSRGVPGQPGAPPSLK